MARPTKLTKSVHETVCEALKAGHSRAAAAGAAGVNESTLRRWLKRGEADDAERRFRQLCADVKRAEVECQSRCLEVLRKAALDGRWQSAAWLLERRWPETWAKRTPEQTTHLEEIVVELL